MISGLTNGMRLQALLANSRKTVTKIGLITSYNPANYTAKVALQPSGILTGWLPVASLWVGPLWGFYSPPSINEQVTVEFIDGSLQAGVVKGRLFNNQDNPLSVPSGELWIVHKKGTFIKWMNDGTLILSDGHGATQIFNGDGTITSAASQWTHTGPVHFTDNVQVDKTLTATTDVIGGGKSLKTHTHTGVQGGDSDTGPPA